MNLDTELFFRNLKKNPEIARSTYISICNKYDCGFMAPFLRQFVKEVNKNGTTYYQNGCGIDSKRVAVKSLEKIFVDWIKHGKCFIYHVDIGYIKMYELPELKEQIEYMKEENYFNELREMQAKLRE